MTLDTPGVHHVTAVTGESRTNVAFYAGTLGLRFVKRTVNFDEPGTYHLYYGDETGSPGTALTFFPFANSPRGTVGRGQVAEIAFAVPPGSLPFWREHLASTDADVAVVEERFGEQVLPVRDPDGQPLALVATDDTDVEPWADGPVPAEHAIRGFAGVTLLSARPSATADVLETLGYERVGSAGDRARYVADGDRATVVDLLEREDPPRGRPGTGTVHHVAFRVPDEETQRAWRDRLREAGLRVTEVKDRQYFRSVYFREPGGILLEIATDGPGFTADEAVEELGEALKLPPWLEDRRGEIESRLDPLAVPGVDA